ncbi:hypothetical protein SUGI_0049080 [Cryptomeria japonica]|nr:hypothetical protein SUGI_0049080 [Cryptomeria japonica]
MDAHAFALSNGRVSVAPCDQPWLSSVPPASPPIDALATLSTPSPALFAYVLGRSLLGGALVGSLDLSSLPHVSAFDHHDFALPPPVQRLVVGGGSLPSSPTPFARGFCVGSPTAGVSDPVLDLDALVATAGDARGEDALPRPFAATASTFETLLGDQMSPIDNVTLSTIDFGLESYVGTPRVSRTPPGRKKSLRTPKCQKN